MPLTPIEKQLLLDTGLKRNSYWIISSNDPSVTYVMVCFPSRGYETIWACDIVSIAWILYYIAPDMLLSDEIGTITQCRVHEELHRLRHGTGGSTKSAALRP